MVQDPSLEVAPSFPCTFQFVSERKGKKTLGWLKDLSVTTKPGLPYLKGTTAPEELGLHYQAQEAWGEPEEKAEAGPAPTPPPPSQCCVIL
jgi:hypothetical protein